MRTEIGIDIMLCWLRVGMGQPPWIKWFSIYHDSRHVSPMSRCSAKFYVLASVAFFPTPTPVWGYVSIFYMCCNHFGFNGCVSRNVENRHAILGGVYMFPGRFIFEIRNDIRAY